MNILITGCSSGIGEQMAISLAEQGYNVLATVLHDDEKEKFTNPAIQTIVLNLLDKQSIYKCVEQAKILSKDKIDVLINNAGIAVAGAIEDVNYDTVAHQFQVNIFGLCEITRLILPLMHHTGSGKIINISSMLGLTAFPYRGIYSASKHALKAVNDALRLELKAIQSPITVTLIECGPMKTNIRENAIKLSGQFLKVDDSRYKNDYQVLLAASKNEQSMLFIKSPVDIMKLIIKIIKSNKPKALYRFGSLPRLLNVLKIVLPISIYDKLILYILSIE